MTVKRTNETPGTGSSFSLDTVKKRLKKFQWNQNLKSKKFWNAISDAISRDPQLIQHIMFPEARVLELFEDTRYQKEWISAHSEDFRNLCAVYSVPRSTYEFPWGAKIYLIIDYPDSYQKLCGLNLSRWEAHGIVDYGLKERAMLMTRIKLAETKL